MWAGLVNDISQNDIYLMCYLSLLYADGWPLNFLFICVFENGNQQLTVPVLNFSHNTTMCWYWSGTVDI